MSLLQSWETLRLHQEEEERLILSEAKDDNLEFVRQIIEKTKVTKEDLRREYTPEEVRQLCLRTKVRVNMTHINCVYDAKKWLVENERITHRSHRFTNAMIIKVLKRGVVLPYPDEIVAEHQYINLCELKKDNNMRLDRWKKQLERQKQLENPPKDEEADFDLSVIEFVDVDGIGDDDEIMEEAGNQADPTNVGNEADAAPSAQTDWLRDIDEINSESMTICSNDLLQSQILSQSEDPAPDYTTFDTQVPSTSTQDSEADKLL
ncbi:telomere-binding protein cav-like [Drosophila tropicalis]|uniref:telomere-binding protein cav-like n=1 Tax=Drosophila tropicalis TaxID=46794 RepID=UPI0035AC2857